MSEFIPKKVSRRSIGHKIRLHVAVSNPGGKGGCLHLMLHFYRKLRRFLLVGWHNVSIVGCTIFLKIYIIYILCEGRTECR